MVVKALLALLLVIFCMSATGCGDKGKGKPHKEE
jgi:hypothetical protein